MSPETTIADFLISAFDDNQLAALRADAIAGKVPYHDANHCVIGHSAIDFEAYMASIPRAIRHTDAVVSFAYNSLGDGEPWTVKARESRRHQRLVELCDAEISRRALLRAEVIEAAKQAVVATF